MAKLGKKGKKKWVKIVAPQEFKNKELGESYVYNENSLIGKKLRVNLMNVIGNPRKQNANLIFEIDKFDGNAKTKLVGYRLSRAYLRRIVRKNIRKLDDSFICETRDKTKIRIKPIMITRGKPNNSTLTGIRLKTREYITNQINKKNTYDVFNSIIGHRLQKEVIGQVKKIHPVATCEFRIVETF